jgi:hypothetical protein
MAWAEQHALATRLDKLPLVLTGPLLRCSNPDSTTVFLALKSADTVTLRVYDASGGARKEVQSGTRATTKLGQHLHVVAVTAKSSNVGLTWGKTYHYDVSFSDGRTLLSPGVVRGTTAEAKAALVYPLAGTTELPCFELPQSDLKKLRIIHASCRKPHGESQDKLRVLNDILAKLKPGETGRPHQLFLTGDQIYADDVAASLLAVITDIGDTLLGWDELLPGVDQTAKQLPPGHRQAPAKKKAGFTSGEASSHLFTLGEFYAMYLLAWSEALWPPELPQWSDVHATLPPGTYLKWRAEAKFKDERTRLLEYRRDVLDVRRALANIPFYTMFDDHEITDDWFFTREWTSDVLNNKSKQLGRRVLLNGLVAYAVFQGWGNTPEQFDAASKPGGRLLEKASLLSATPAATDIDALEGIVLPELKPGLGLTWYTLKHKPGALDWHYRYVGPSYEVLVLDSRTCREYRKEKADPPSLISTEALPKMVPEYPPAGTSVTLVVAPAPVIGVELVERHIQENVAKFDHGANAVEELLGVEGKTVRVSPYPDVEAWGLSVRTFEALLARLLKHRQRVVILSGDVHYGFAARLRYWADRPLDAPARQPQTTHGVIAQLTASALKNESDFPPTKLLHAIGFVPSPFTVPTIERGGWNDVPEVDVPFFSEPGSEEKLKKVLHEDPVVLDRKALPAGATVSSQPDWSYRINFMETARSASALLTPPPAAWTRDESMNIYVKQALKDLEALKEVPGREIVGLNNLGDVTFDWSSSGAKLVIQKLWWNPPGVQCAPYHSCTVSLDPGNEMFAPFPTETP